MFAMNKDRYESLPDDLKAVIDNNSGMSIADKAGKLWDEIEGPGIMLQEKSGSPVKALDQAATDAFAALGEQVTAKWIEEANGNGIDGAALAAAAKASVKAHTK